jgi:polar amino acid transport system substrate-binding protein
MTIGILILGSHASFGESIIVLGNVDKPPKQWKDANGNLKGIWVDILRAIDDEIKDVEFQIGLKPFKRAQKEAIDGKNALMAIFYNDTRAKIFDYSEPVLTEDVVIVVKKGREFPFKSLDDLKDKTIGIFRGTSYGVEWEKAVTSGKFKTEEDSNNTGRLKKILKERIDGGVFNPGAAAVKMFCDHDADLNINQFTVLKTPILTKNSYFAVAKKLNKKALITKFNNALNQIKKSGKYEKIIEKYSK